MVQVGHSTSRLDWSKVSSLAATLASINSGVAVVQHRLALDSSNALATLAGYDVVLDCTDNVATRYLLNDCCVLLDKVIVASAKCKTLTVISLF